MIGFTVMDHDVITANDFAGEAFLSLNNIPGVAELLGVENFHGLKAIDLVLMQQKDKRKKKLKLL
jgi:BAI1-associated protein 3